MGTLKAGKKFSVNVVHASNQGYPITEHDAEMDVRATQAVKAALTKAKVCNKPIAKYDFDAKRAYVEYANGERKYVN